MCRLLGVSRSGYYGYQSRNANKPEDPEYAEMIEAIRAIVRDTEDSYGSRRMRKALNVLSYPVSREKTRRLMREAGVYAKRRKKYKVTTNSDHKLPVYENKLKRRFDVA